MRRAAVRGIVRLAAEFDPNADHENGAKRTMPKTKKAAPTARVTTLAVIAASPVSKRTLWRAAYAALPLSFALGS